MSLIDGIINELIDDSKSLNSALLKTKVLASKMKNSNVFNWVNSELNGYTNIKDLPTYRILPANATGTFANNFVVQKNVAIPWMTLDKEFQEFFTKMKLTNSISNLEYHINNDEGDIGIMFPSELCSFVTEHVGNGSVLISGKVSASKNLIVELLNNVRSRLLDFLLQLQKDFHNDSEYQQNEEKIDNIFSGTIIGNNNVILSGNNNVQNVSYGVRIGDINSLVKELKKHKIEEVDIAELERILGEEKALNNNYGPKLKKWYSKMLEKSIEGTWKLPITLATNILSVALKNYFGF